MSTKHLKSIILVIIFIVYGVLCLNITEWNWRLQFSADAVIRGHFESVTAMSALHCGHWCLSTAGCQAFGYNSGSKVCWLYGHLVEYYNLSDTTEPGTRYFWRPSPRCPTHLNYTLTANVCYKIHMTMMTWDEARKMCHSEGGILFVGNTAEKLALLQWTTSRIFVGASDADSEGDWFWLDGTALPTNTSSWGQGQPDDWEKREDVATLKALVLNDYRQNDTAYAACEIFLV